MTTATNATPAWQSLRERLVRRPVVAAVTGLLALSLAACGGGDTASLIGTLDRAFGAGSNDGTPDGMVNLSLGSGNDHTRATLVQADGKILVIGSSTSTGATGANIVIERFNSDGTLDASFGAGNGDGSPDGVVSLDLGAGADEGSAIALQSDGKIVIAGTHTANDNSKNIVVARLTTAGALDPSFGADGDSDGTPDGVVSLSLGADDDIANAVAIQSDGKILVAGKTGPAGNTNAVVARLNTNGSLDSSFGADSGGDGSPDGFVTLSLGNGSEEAVAIALQADGRAVVVGNSSSVGGNGSSNIVVARLNGDGSLDADFGTANDGTPNGVVNVSLGDGNDVASAVAIQANGKILVAGSTVSGSGKNAAVARLNADGSLDSSFGAGTSDGTPDGAVAVSLGNGDDELSAIAVDADGKIVVVGSTTSTGGSSNVFVARLLGNGSLDTEFGQGDDGTPDGVVNLSFGDGNDFGRAVALQADGKIVVAGDRVNGSSSDIVLARLLVKN